MPRPEARKVDGGGAWSASWSERRPPFSPEYVVEEFASVLKQYRVTTVVGDRYGGEFCREPFRRRGSAYRVAHKAKSDLYASSCRS